MTYKPYQENFPRTHSEEVPRLAIEKFCIKSDKFVETSFSGYAGLPVFSKTSLWISRDASQKIRPVNFGKELADRHQQGYVVAADGFAIHACPEYILCPLFEGEPLWN